MGDEQIAKATADYEADRAAKSAAAFAIIDKNGDRTIQLDEFVAAMDFEGEKSKDFQKALGFDDSAMGGGKGGGRAARCSDADGAASRARDWAHILVTPAA